MEILFAEKKSEANEKRKKVDELGKKSKSGKELVYDLAKKENEFREILKDRKIEDKETVELLADAYSDEPLETLKALHDLEISEKERLIDQLTGLRNRRALENEASKLLSLAHREGKDCAVLMIDFDYFKKVNDEYGHLAGDQALKALAEVLRNCVRKSDFAYRYGGEEFTILLFNVNNSNALKAAEKLRKFVENFEIKITSKEGKSLAIKKTVSVGCCSTENVPEWKADFKSAGASFKEIADQMIQNADRALFHSKEGGRNRVTSCTELEKDR